MKKVTIKDIAKIAGVNPSTVSRSLNDNPVIPEKTRKRIKDIAKKLNFEFNSSARNLSLNKTDNIGLIISNGFDSDSTMPFVSIILEKTRKILSKNSLDTIVEFSKNIYTNESNIQKMISAKKVDGFLILDSNFSKKEFNLLKKHKIPFEIMHFKPNFENSDNYGYTATDHFEGGVIATDFLIENGFKNVFTITAIQNDISFNEFTLRTAGYRYSLTKNQIEINENNILYTNISYEDTYKTIKDNIHKFKKGDAIFAQTDIMAFAVINALREYNLNVPNDISVIGYDNIDMARYFYPALTTIMQPLDELIEKSCYNLVKKIKNVTFKDNYKTLIKPKLIIRDSVLINH
ncbi:MAG: transcriptional regulator, LacI family [Fusobacteriales bacterium]|jgi:DNA-binding LacI/PurR family transcriptional regulator|nr:transcriptional regulator, LacI family [Fusobacteriales bacterium]